jgi:small subunit ribosomal protein S16
VAVKIRLKRLGKIRAPYYRIVVADSRTKRDGRAIEEIGKYHPTEEPSLIEVDRERAQYWLGVGAQPTEQVMALLKVTGDWQTFRGEPGAEGTLRVKERKAPVQAPAPAATAPAATSSSAAAPSGSGAPAPVPAAPQPQPAEVANAEQPEGADEQAEAGSGGTND